MAKKTKTSDQKKTIRLTYHYGFAFLAGIFIFLGTISLANFGLKTLIIGNNFRIDYAQTEPPDIEISNQIENIDDQSLSDAEKDLLLNWAISYQTQSQEPAESSTTNTENTKYELIRSTSMILVAFPFYWYHRRKIRHILNE